MQPMGRPKHTLNVYAIENTSPAKGAYSEGLVNARLTPVVLPTFSILIWLMKANLRFCEMLSNESLVRRSSGYITKASPGYPNCCWAVVKLL